MTKTIPEIAATPLYQGTFSVGLDKKFNRINRDDPPAKGALKISLNPFLIKSDKRNYLFDIGIGDFGENTSARSLKESLKKYDLGSSDITDIFASHLHYDHIGGLAGRNGDSWELTFPDAKVWVSKKAWNKVMNLDEYYDKEKSEFIWFLNDNADLHFLKEEDQPYPEIQVKKIGGHTEFSQVLLYDDGDHKYLMAGDVLATRGEVNRKFAAKYDFDAETSMNVRKELTKKAFDEGFTVLGYHDSHHPLFKLTDYDDKQGYTITNVETDVPA